MNRHEYIDHVMGDFRRMAQELISEERISESIVVLNAVRGIEEMGNALTFACIEDVPFTPTAGVVPAPAMNPMDPAQR